MNDAPTINKHPWFSFEGFVRMRTDYKTALELDALILNPKTTQTNITEFIKTKIAGVNENERKV
jgi:hypothetical protein